MEQLCEQLRALLQKFAVDAEEPLGDGVMRLTVALTL